MSRSAEWIASAMCGRHWQQTSINNLSFTAHVFRREEWIDKELCKPIQRFFKVDTLDVEIKYRLQKCNALTLQASIIKSNITVLSAVMSIPQGQSGLEAKILALALISASASNIWPRPSLNLVVLLCNQAFFGQKSCKIRKFC